MKEIDKKILLQLAKDGKQPIRDIAKRVGASRQTVAKRMEQLREDGVILSFAARLNHEKFGLNTKAYILLHEDPRMELRHKNEAEIKKFHQVSGFHRLFGRYSSILEVRVTDSKELTNLIKRIHRLKGVKDTETFIVHSTVKDEPEEPFIRVLTSKV